MAVDAFLKNLPLAYATSLAWLLLAFLVSRFVHRNNIVDVFWGLGFVVVDLEALVVSNAWSADSASPWWENDAPIVRWLTFGVVALWAIRLSGHLARRQRDGQEDPRYEKLVTSSSWHPTLYALTWIYGVQSVLLFTVSLALQWTAFARTFYWPVAVAGGVVAVVGVVWETVADEQLRRFMSSPRAGHETMNHGLWRLSRHPNYFGDAVSWWGIFVVAAASGWGTVFVVSPVVMTYLLTRVSGTPMLEAKLLGTRPGYDHYVATTSAFVPRRPRRQPPTPS